jgi:general secretion pathway protein L
LGQDLEEWRAALGIPVEILPVPRQGVSVSSDGGIPWPGWAIPFGLAFREVQSRTASQINLLQGPFAPQTGAGPWKKAAAQAGVYLVVLLALWGLGAWSEVSYEGAQYRALVDAIREEFRRALPEVKNVVSELDQMRSRVEELEGRAQSLGSLVDREVSTLRILREISTRVPKDLEVEFRDFTFEEGRIRIEGVTTSFDAIDKIKVDLAEYPRFSSVTVIDAKQGVKRDEVLFKLAITLGRKG